MTTPDRRRLRRAGLRRPLAGRRRPRRRRALGIGADAVGPPPTGLLLPDAASYVVFLVDGLGAELLRRYAHAAPYLSSLLEGSATGTAGVPSTTATSLTSLGTGLRPARTGWSASPPGCPAPTGCSTHLWWDKRVDPLEWQPHPTAFARLGAAGVQVTVVNKREFEGSGLTVAAHRGAELRRRRPGRRADRRRWSPRPPPRPR